MSIKGFRPSQYGDSPNLQEEGRRGKREEDEQEVKVVKKCRFPECPNDCRRRSGWCSGHQKQVTRNGRENMRPLRWYNKKKEEK